MVACVNVYKSVPQEAWDLLVASDGALGTPEL